MTDNAERRRSLRAPVPEGATVEFRRDNGKTGVAALSNLSMSGLFATTDKPAYLGDDLQLTLQIPGLDPIVLSGRVARISNYRHAPGMAVNFLEGEDEKLRANDKLLELFGDQDE